MSYINIARIYPRLDWDNDIGKWTLREEDLEKLECEAEDPESLRPKGEWKLNEDGKWACTYCDSLAIEHPTDTDWQVITAFCPNCGADTRGDNNEC